MRVLMRCTMIALGLVALLAGAAAAQTSARSAAAQRTPWGDPDLQGTWDYWTFTPLERPAELAPGVVLTPEEAARFAERLRRQALQGDETVRPGDPGAY